MKYLEIINALMNEIKYCDCEYLDGDKNKVTYYFLAPEEYISLVTKRKYYKDKSLLIEYSPYLYDDAESEYGGPTAGIIEEGDVVKHWFDLYMPSNYLNKLVEMAERDTSIDDSCNNIETIVKIKIL